MSIYFQKLKLTVLPNFTSSTHKIERPMSSFWLIVGSMALACSWLLPNHYMPWAGFHADAWTSLILGLGAIAVIWRSNIMISWHLISLISAALVAIPFLQYAFDIIPFAGQAWVSTAYLTGFVVALLIGARWELINPSQLENGLFLAVGIASVLSVGFQLHQWLGLSGFDLVVMKLEGNRPYANLGQPNQLGTLLLWGLLACAWGVISRKIRISFAVLLASFFLFGIALTQSRTAWIGFAIILIAAWWWRKLWPSRHMALILGGLTGYFVLCNWVLSWLGGVLGVQQLPLLVGRFSGEIRPIAWKLFLEAIWQHPWFGYGFTEVAHAQLGLSLEYPGLGGAFGQAHNFVLDLLLWCGLPIGLSICIGLCYWFVKCVQSVKNGRDAISIAVIAVVGNHAMTELPLHYAYFLLPTGLLIGVLNTRLKSNVLFYTSRSVLFFAWLIGMTMMSAIIIDYFHVEDNFNAWRFERAGVGVKPPTGPPDVLLLTQLREKMRFARYEPEADLSEKQLDWMREIVISSPSAYDLHKLATIMALNGRIAESQTWLKKLCKITPPQECALVGRVWAQQSLESAKIATVKWPN
jgi:O-antigen ligase